MANNDNNNDEYQLDDQDLLVAEPEHQFKPEPMESVSKAKYPAFIENMTLPRVLIALGFIVLLMFCYLFIGSFVSGSKSTGQAEIIPIEPIKKVTLSPLETMLPRTPAEPQLNQKLSRLEEDQKSISTDVLSINNQLSGVSTTVNTIATKMADLNGLIAALNEKIEMQSRDIERLHAAERRPKRTPSRIKLPREQAAVYAIQAVIPGRAWLIAGNGMTLTVREGTSIAGYGVVKLIDPKQGRVITSSGQIIRFSQTDS